jgi:hypothetical protein
MVSSPHFGDPLGRRVKDTRGSTVNLASLGDECVTASGDSSRPLPQSPIGKVLRTELRARAD